MFDHIRLFEETYQFALLCVLWNTLCIMVGAMLSTEHGPDHDRTLIPSVY